MICPKMIRRRATKSIRWFADNWLAVVGVLSLIIGVLGLIFTLTGISAANHPDPPRQELSYQVIRPLEAVEIEIKNTGADHIWYDSAYDRPEKALPVYIETTPPVRILDARVVSGKVGDNGFRLLENEEWMRGRVECRWRRLVTGESVVIRIVYLGMKKPPAIRLTGELRGCLVPRETKLPKIQTRGKRVVGGAALLFLVAILTLLLAWPGLLALKKRDYDRQMLEKLDIPEGVAGSLSVYWRREVLQRLGLLVRLIRFVVCVMRGSFVLIFR